MNNSFWSSSVLAMILALLPLAALPQIQGSRVPGGCEVAAPPGDGTVGCYLNATEELKSLPRGELFWHLYQYPTRAEADAAKPVSVGTVTEALGKVWLYAIQTEDWRPPLSGQRVAVIGPLPVQSDKRYTARYMQAVFPPGMETAVHTHSGPEAWYIVSGVQCLRTPQGASVTRAGAGAVVPPGPPMVLTSLGTEMRRSVLLVLHDSAQAWMTIASDWKPDRECPQQ
jgi:quercetin dioxygenase-like cupin family protein